MSPLPDFLVMGVPKAGTTSFHHYLAQHPQVFLPERKEVHHFSRPALLRCTAGPGDALAATSACDSFERYVDLFGGARPDQVIGEVSPSYFYFTECYGPIREALGDGVKLIVLFRNPIDRAFSNYLHLRRSGRETLPLLAALEREDERIRQGYGDFWRYKDHSRYADRLAELRSMFPAEHVLLLSSHELAHDRVAALRRVSRFLGIDDTFLPSDLDRAFNAGRRTVDGRIAAWLMSPSTSTLRARLKRSVPDAVTHAYRRVRDAGLARGREPLPSLDDDSYEHLMAAVGVEIARMRDQHGLDLSISTYRPEPSRST